MGAEHHFERLGFGPSDQRGTGGGHGAAPVVGVEQRRAAGALAAAPGSHQRDRGPPGGQRGADGDALLESAAHCLSEVGARGGGGLDQRQHVCGRGLEHLAHELLADSEADQGALDRIPRGPTGDREGRCAEEWGGGCGWSGKLALPLDECLLVSGGVEILHDHRLGGLGERERGGEGVGGAHRIGEQALRGELGELLGAVGCRVLLDGGGMRRSVIILLERIGKRVGVVLLVVAVEARGAALGFDFDVGPSEEAREPATETALVADHDRVLAELGDDRGDQLLDGARAVEAGGLAQAGGGVGVDEVGGVRVGGMRRLVLVGERARAGGGGGGTARGLASEGAHAWITPIVSTLTPGAISL